MLDVNGDGLADFLSDQTYQDDWQVDHNKQFKLTFARLTEPVQRSGWNTDDKIAGGSKGDTLKGLGGDDVLIGNDGGDRLLGGPGRDTLRGGPGKDKLAGGSDEDRFEFRESDDLRSCPDCDLIEDFRAGEDLLDLSDVDAAKGPGNQTFKFIGKGQVHRQEGRATALASRRC